MNNRSINIYRIIWVGCIFLLLIVILLMVMDYKINYQYLEENYLYFYECDEEVCINSTSDDDLVLYSRYECRYEECPKFDRIINEDYALLKESDNSYELYNYKNGNVISAGYDNYAFINDDYIIVTQGTKQGIIDKDDNVVIDLIYDQIGWYTNSVLNGYNSENIVAKKGDKFGIISFKTGEVKEGFTYSEDRIEELLVIIEV